MNITQRHLFKEFEPPILQKIMQINQPQDDISLQFWDHLICAFQNRRGNNCKTQQQNGKMMSYIFYKGKVGNIVLLHFQQRCLMLQKSFKLVYGIQKQVTCIKIFDFGYNNNQIIKQNQKINQKSESIANAILCVGFQDSTIQIYYFNHKQSTLVLKKIILLRSSSNVSEPIMNIIIHQNDLYVAKPHFISLYKEVVKEIMKKICGSEKQQLVCSETNIKFKELMESTRVSIFVNKNLHIYTQTLGLYSFSLPNLTKIGSLVDQIKCFYETEEDDWVLGSSQDNLKVIYNDSNQIQRFVGLKNFPSCIESIKSSNMIQLFVCDMNGELFYFRKQIKKESQIKSEEESQQKELTIFDQKLKQGKKISEFGIKKLILLEGMLIIHDNQQNITIFDVLDKQINSTSRAKTFSTQN